MKDDTDGLVTCFRFSDGEAVQVPKQRMRFGPSVYAIIRHGDSLLLILTPDGRYFFPGGEIELGETLKEALVREVGEETGRKIRAAQFFCYKERMILFDNQDGESDQCSHCMLLFFAAELLDPADFEQPLVGVDESVEGQPFWMSIEGLQPDQFREPAGLVFASFLYANS